MSAGKLLLLSAPPDTGRLPSAENQTRWFCIADSLPALSDGALQIMKAADAEEIVGKIVFALPLQLHRRVHLQRDGRSLAHIVIHQPAAKATSGTRLVNHHLVFRQLQHLGDLRHTPICLLTGDHISITPSCHHAVLVSGSSCWCETIA